MSDKSSSPNLLDKDDNDNDSSAEFDEEDDDDKDPSAKVNEEDDDDEDPSARVDEEDESSDEVNIEAVIKKKGSRFWWSHTTDCIVNNGNSEDEALICILLVKEPWNAGHSRVMKALQNLLAIVLETVVDGDKIFQGVSEATLKKGISYIMTLARNGSWKRRNVTNQRTKKRNMI